MYIKEFLEGKPSVSQILEFIESEAQRIAQERRKAAQGAGEHDN